MPFREKVYRFSGEHNIKNLLEPEALGKLSTELAEQANA